MLFQQCANINVAGGSSDQGNAVVSGRVTDPQGNGVARATVRLLPQQYIPRVDMFNPESLVVRADSLGNFQIPLIEKGIYCLSGSDSTGNLSGFRTSITVDSEDVKNISLQIQEPGRMIIPIDDTVWSNHKKLCVYIPGTLLYRIVDSGTGVLSFDTMYSGMVSLLAYSYTLQSTFLLNNDLAGCFVYPGIQTNLIAKPFKPRGPQNGIIAVSFRFFTFFEYWKINSNISVDYLEYRFYWGPQDTSAWNNTLSNSHTWKQAGAYEIRIQVRYGFSNRYENNTGNIDILQPFYSAWSDKTTISITPSVISGLFENNGNVTPKKEAYRTE
jgi:hypothetical protein